MATHLTTSELKQGSTGFFLRLNFELKGFTDSYLGQTWRVKIICPDGTVLSKTTGIQFLSDTPKISIPIDDFDLIQAGRYYYQVTLITGGATINASVESFDIEASLPDGLAYSIISSSYNYFPIFTSGGGLAQSTLSVDVDTDLNYSGGGAKFAGDVQLADEVYGAAWSTKLEAPTKKSLYAKIESLISGYGTENAQDDVGNILTNSATISFTYSDATPSITASVIQSGLTLANLTGNLPESRITNLVTDLAAKEPTIASGLTTQYWRGDKSWQILDKTAIGLSNVVNVDTTNAANLSSGTLPAGRFPVLTGDVSTAGGSLATTISTAAVTLAKMANVASGSVFYRKTSGVGVPEIQTLATLKTDLGLTGTNSGDQTITLTGDVTGSGTGSFAATLATVNSNVGTFNGITVNAKGLVTAAANITSAIYTEGGNTSTSFALKLVRNTDSSPAGFLIYGRNAADNATLFSVDVLGNATGNSFVKSGGTSTQFLKADGSVDSSTYLTANQTITLSGDVSGSGSTAITTTIGANKVTLGMMATLAANSIIGNNTGSPATPIALTASQVKTLLALNNVENTALSTWAGSTSLITLGTVTTGTWSATSILATKGGTGISTYTLGDILYSDATNSLAKLSGNTTTTRNFLRQTGNGTISAAPAWDTVTKTDVGLANVQNVDQTNASNLTSGTVGTARLGGGSASNTTFLRGDQTWAAPTLVETDTLATVTGRGNTSSTGLDLTENGNTSTSYALRLTRNTDTSSVGFFIQARNTAANANLYTLDTAGNVTANSFIKSSGTSAQFLKADGTVDSSTYLTANQTITLSGDVSGSGTTAITTTIGANKVLTTMIADANVTLAKMANVATASVFYRKTAGTGVPEVQTLATLKTDLGLTGTNSGDQTITLTGDVTGSGTGSFAATLATVNSNVGTFNGITVNAKGLVTAAANITSASYTEGANTGTSFALKLLRFTDTSPVGFLILGRNAADSATVWSVDVSGNETANSFIKSGGTSAQFLKADGTVDSSTYLTANQTITLSGDVSGSGTTAITTAIGANKVTLGMMAQVATSTVFYRKTASTGNVEVQTLATLKTDLGLTGTNSGDQTITLTGDVTGSGTGSFAATLATVNSNVGTFNGITVNAKGLVTAAANVSSTTYTEGANTSTSFALKLLRFTDISPVGFLIYGRNAADNATIFSVDASGNVTGNSIIKSGGTSAQFLKADGSVDSSTYLTANQTITLSGDISGSGTTAITTAIGANKVTLGMMSTLAANSIIGNNTGSTATPIALTAAQVKTLLSLNNVENTALSTWAGTTNITTLGTITSGTWSATSIGPTKGGTGLSSYALGDTLYSSATNTLSALAGNTTATKKFLTQTGNGTISAAPAWGVIATGDLGTGTANTTTYLRGDLSWQTISSSLTVGNAIGGGGADRVLYEDASSNLAANANFTFVPSTGSLGSYNTLTVTGADAKIAIGELSLYRTSAPITVISSTIGLAITSSAQVDLRGSIRVSSDYSSYIDFSGSGTSAMQFKHFGGYIGGYQLSNAASTVLIKQASTPTANAFEVQPSGSTTPIFSIGSAGAVTGLSFIKTGGTSAQFLKADGTVDSSTYLTTVNNSNWSGTALSIANGGTGQVTAQAAIDALLPTQTGNSGKFLTTNGTTSSWSISGASWGSITGTLSSQTDLNTALNAKVGKGATVYLSDYASIALAITAIGSTVTDLVIDTPMTTAASATFLPTTRVRFSGNGKITIGSGHTLTIGLMEDPGNKQVFVQTDATSNIRFTQGGVARMNIAWLVGTNGGTITNAMNQYLATSSANGGGVIYVPSGLWLSAGGHQMHNSTIIEGDTLAIPGSGTTIRMTAAGSSESANVNLFEIGSSTYNCFFKNFGIDGNSLAYTCGIRSNGTYPNTSSNVRLEGIYIKNCRHGLRIEGVGTNAASWQQAQYYVDANCVFEANTYSGVYYESANSAMTFEGNIYVGGGGYAFYIGHAGAITCKGTEFGGTAYTGDSQLIANTITGAATSTANVVVTVTAAGMTGSPATIFVPVVSGDSAAAVARKIRLAIHNDPKTTTFFHVGNTPGDAVVRLIALDPAATDGTMAVTLTGAGVTSSGSSIVGTGSARSGMAAAVFYVAGAHGPISCYGTQDEGFDNSIVNNASDVNSSFNFFGCLVQSAVRLNQTCRLNIFGGVWGNKVIRDAASSQVTAHGVTISHGVYIAPAGTTTFFETLQKINNFSPTVGTSAMLVNQDPETGRMSMESSVRIFQNDNAFSTTDRAWLEVLSTRNQATLRVGACDNTGNPTFYYDFQRNVSDGILEIMGNQSGFTGLRVNGFIFTIDEAYSAGWDGALSAPTKNAVYDKIEAILGNSTFTSKIQTTLTTEQMRIRYDASNYMTATVSSAGVTTFDGAGSSASFVFNKSTEFLAGGGSTWLPFTDGYNYLSATGTIFRSSSNTEWGRVDSSGSNLRIKPRPDVQTGGGTNTPNVDTYNMFVYYSIGSAMTIANPTGTPNAHGERITFRMTDNGTARAITWGGNYRPMSTALPTTTIAGKTRYMEFIYNAETGTWDCIRIETQA